MQKRAKPTDKPSFEEKEKQERAEAAERTERRKQQRLEKEQRLREDFDFLDEMLDDGFRFRSQKAHPDHGGSHDEMARLNRIRALGKKLIAAAVDDDQFDFFMD